MRLFYILCCCLPTLALTAQGELTVEQIQRQGQFIEAKREALLGKTDEAIAKFTDLADADDKDDAVQFELARLYRAKDELSEATDHMRRAYAARPGEVYASFLADLYQETGRHQEGADLYESLRKRNPEKEAFYLEEAAFLVRAQDIKGAIAVYNELESRIGVNAELARLKHSLYLGTGDAKRAEKELLALIESKPNVLDYQHLLAGFYTSQNNPKAAEKVYRDILRAEPADVRAQLALQNTGGSIKPDASSDDQLLALLGRPDVDIDLKIGKVLPLVQELARTRDAGQLVRAQRLAQELRRVHPDEAKATALVGDIYFQAGDLTGAADAYIATLKLDDNVYPVWEQLLGTLYLANRTVELRKYAEEALDLYPNRPAVYVHYAIAEALRANYGEAGSLLSEAELMVSGQPDAATALREISKAFAVLQGESGSVDAAKLPGGKTGPLGFLMTSASDLPALQAYDSPTNTNAVFLEKLGDALMKAGEKASATAAYGRAKAAGSRSKTLPAGS